MKLVWVTPYLPFPITTGGRRRIASLLRRVSRTNEITMLSYARGETAKDLSDVRKLVDALHVVPRRPTKHPLNALLWAVGPWPFMAIANGFNGTMVHELRRVVENEKPDVIHCEHFHMAQVVGRARQPSWPPVVLSQQGIEFVVTQRFSSVPRSPLMRIGLRIELAKARRWESSACREADLVLAVSDDDARAMASIVPADKTRVVPNGVDIDTFHPRGEGIDPTSEVMLFVGTFSFFGNRDALRCLVNEIMPEVRRRRPEARLTVIGDAPPALRGDNVEYLGAVERVEPYLQGARLLIAPLRTGSGTKLKLLEAMACGIPFVTTSYGIEGIPGADQAGLVADDIPGLARAAVKLLEDPAMAQRLGARGRVIVEQSYSWDHSARALEQAWKDVVL